MKVSKEKFWGVWKTEMVFEGLNPQRHEELYVNRLYDHLKELGFVLVEEKQLRERLASLGDRLQKQPYPYTNLDSLILHAGIGFIKEVLGE